MSLQPKPYYSFEDYLAAERESTDAKHEYVAGQVFAMAGASFNHNLITANLAGELRQQLKSRPCTVLSSDMRLRVLTADAGAHPDRCEAGALTARPRHPCAIARNPL